METPRGFVEALKYVGDNIAVDMPVQQLRCLFVIAEVHPEFITHTEIEELTGITQSSVSRHMKALGVKMVETSAGNYIKKGLQLIETVPDPFGSRRLASRLSKAGEKHIKAITTIVEKGGHA